MRVLLRRPMPGATEIAYRGRQELEKLLERTVRLLPVASAAGHAIAPSPFFAGATQEATAGLCAREAPDHVVALHAQAERLAQQRFDLLGYRDLSYGSPIDWHLDPIRERRAPLVHWSRIDALDCGAIGDSKLIWEANRHQWLVTLAQTYRVGGDRRLVEQIFDALRHWLRANPIGIGVNWSSSLEVSLRLIAWCWVLRLLDGPWSITAHQRDLLARGIAVHARHVSRYLSYYYSPNTHLTGEALGLFYAGTVLDGPHADKWRRLGARILIEEASRQILADGVFFEQATCYQRYTADIYLHFLILASQTRFPVPSEVRAQVLRLLDAMLALRLPDGSMPQIGDADGGWLLPLASRRPDDCRGVFSTAAAFFSRADYAWAAGSLAPETIWLLGNAGVERFKALQPEPPQTPASCVLRKGGYVVMRDSWEPSAHQLIFDAGPLGCPASGGHGHADLLSVQVSAFGQPCLIDPGTGEYPDDRGWRSAMRSTAAHSTVTVDGLNQISPAGLFSWQGARPTARLRSARITARFDVADASHDAFVTATGPVTHRRRVMFVKPHLWVVVDDLTGAGTHLVETRWQFAPLELSDDGSPAVLAHLAGGHGLWLIPVAPGPLSQRIALGATNPDEGWHSPAYGQRAPAPLVAYQMTAPLPLRLATVLIPQAVATKAPPEVVSERDATGTLRRLVIPEFKVALSIGDGEMQSCAE